MLKTSFENKSRKRISETFSEHKLRNEIPKTNIENKSRKEISKTNFENKVRKQVSKRISPNTLPRTFQCILLKKPYGSLPPTWDTLHWSFYGESHQKNWNAQTNLAYTSEFGLYERSIHTGGTPLMGWWGIAKHFFHGFNCSLNWGKTQKGIWYHVLTSTNLKQSQAEGIRCTKITCKAIMPRQTVDAKGNNAEAIMPASSNTSQ